MYLRLLAQTLTDVRQRLDNDHWKLPAAYSELELKGAEDVALRLIEERLKRPLINTRAVAKISRINPEIKKMQFCNASSS
jgi:hypothetical protein